MKVTYYKYFKPDVSVHHVVDDFGNERDIGHDSNPLVAYRSFNMAKVFVTGMTFDEANLLSILPANEEH